MPVRDSSILLRRPVNHTKRKVILALGLQSTDGPKFFGKRL
jgi:hypothetical protein